MCKKNLHISKKYCNFVAEFDKLQISSIMNNFGFVRVAAAVPVIHLADCFHNVKQMKSMIDEAIEEGVEIISFPELSVTGYTCADLFFTQQLQRDALKALEELCAYTRNKPIIVLVGAPLKADNNLYNCAFVMTDGEVRGVVPKTNLPNTGEFYEKRWFTSGRAIREANGKPRIPAVELWAGEVPFGVDLIFEANNYTFGIEICEDLWSPLPPSTQLAIQGAELIFNLSSSNEVADKHTFRQHMITQQSARVHCGYIYTSSGAGESTTDVVFAGSTYIAENGDLLLEGERFQRENTISIMELDIQRLRTDRQRNTNFTKDQLGHYRRVQVAPLTHDKVADEVVPLHRTFSMHPFLPEIENQTAYCADILNIQLAALAHRWEHTHAQSIVIGVSGGLDSTLALLVAVLTADLINYDRSRVIAVTMPGFGTSDRTYNNAVKLMENLGVSIHEIPIRDMVTLHLNDIGHDINARDVTYENAQARVRTLVLMDMANKYNGLVLGTGDMSELALGWCTYNGDHMSMYGINAGIPKTLVRLLVTYAAENIFADTVRTILLDVCETPVSPELLPTDEKGDIAQLTEDKLGPYELHDFFLYYFLRYGFTREKIAFMACVAFEDKYLKEQIEHWLDLFFRRFYSQQFKRTCLPDGPKVLPLSLSPRGDLRMPSDV